MRSWFNSNPKKINRFSHSLRHSYYQGKQPQEEINARFWYSVMSGIPCLQQEKLNRIRHQTDRSNHCQLQHPYFPVKGSNQD